MSIEVAARRVQIINTHLSVRALDRSLLVKALLGSDWLAHPACREPLVVCGDFNTLPRSYVHRPLIRLASDHLPLIAELRLS